MENGLSIQVDGLVGESKSLSSSKGGKEMCRQEGRHNLESSEFCDSTREEKSGEELSVERDLFL